MAYEKFDGSDVFARKEAPRRARQFGQVHGSRLTSTERSEDLKPRPTQGGSHER
jgi:hypothetical protein